jgi:hypothetical protein
MIEDSRVLRLFVTGNQDNWFLVKISTGVSEMLPIKLETWNRSKL